METKIIKAVFGGGRYAVTTKRTRTDYGQVLEFVGVDLPDTFECIFSNSNTSAGVGKKQIGSAQRVLIPDEYLATGQTIYAWVLVHDSEDDGRHMYNVKIPVDDMPDLSPEDPTPVEQSVISQAITALNTAVDTTSQKAQEASESADRAEHAAEGVEGYAERAEAAQNASGSARDIALEAKVSAQASAATASEKASEAISSATTASQSALTAETASESASASADASYQNAQTAYRYAQDSATSAGQAESYASGAGIYASDAQTHSQTASQKASEAAQSASTAVQAKTDAESAKTASQTAQTASESARDGAVTVKTDAESARDEAQSIVNGITGKVEQIDSNTERIESLEDDRYKPYPTDIVSGSIASFPDGADGIPLKSCIVQVEPVQEGSGDPSPDNVRPITGWTGCVISHSGADTSNPTTYPITFPSEAGIVYGAYVDVINGELAATHAEVDMGTLSWTYYPSGNYFYATIPDRIYYIEALPKVVSMCDKYKYFGLGNSSELQNNMPNANYGFTTTSAKRYIYLKDNRYTSVDDLVASLSGTQLVYALTKDSIITYPLTQIEIPKTLLGTNNIWTDAGDTEVTYRADTKLYISRLTEPDADMVADANITSGSYFMVGNDLYRATVNIASGANVIEGTNAIKVSLATALNEINA